MHSLAGEPTKRLGDLLAREESKYLKKAQKAEDPVRHAQCHTSEGFWINGDTAKELLYCSYFRNFHKAVEQVYRSPIEGLGFFNKFFSFIAKSPVAKLIPSPGSTARLMEIMTVLIVGVHLSTNENTFAILPASYLTALRCWDAALGGSTYLSILKEEPTEDELRQFRGRTPYPRQDSLWYRQQTVWMS